MLINSLLDTDFYTFTVWQMAFHLFPQTQVEYQFRCRNEIDLTPYKERIERELNAFCELRFSQMDLELLKAIPFLKTDFIEYLEDFKPKRRCCVVQIVNNKLAIKIIGSWINTIIFEVPVLAIVNELHFQASPNDVGYKRLQSKIDLVKEYNGKNSQRLQFADFGTRRRYSRIWQDSIVDTLVKELPDNFIGTSNVKLAMKYGVKPIGTMSHQLIQAGQGLPNVRISESQRFMLDAWVREYRGDLGIALSDTLGFDAFLRDFDKFFAKLYDGVRHDSGCPFEWCEKLIKHYTDLGIDPMTKTAVFSDGLTFPVAYEIFDRFLGKIKMSFGIGTNLTNDCGYEPLQIVIKLVEVNGKPVAKISDSKGKGMCTDDGFLNYLRKEFRIGEYAE